MLTSVHVLVSELAGEEKATVRGLRDRCVVGVLFSIAVSVIHPAVASATRLAPSARPPTRASANIARSMSCAALSGRKPRASTVDGFGVSSTTGSGGLPGGFT